MDEWPLVMPMKFPNIVTPLQTEEGDNQARAVALS